MNKRTIIFIVQTLLFILLSFASWYYYAAEYGQSDWTMTVFFKSVAFIINLPMFFILLLTGIPIYAFPIVGPIINGLLDSLILTGIIILIKTIIKKIKFRTIFFYLIALGLFSSCATKKLFLSEKTLNADILVKYKDNSIVFNSKDFSSYLDNVTWDSLFPIKFKQAINLLHLSSDTAIINYNTVDNYNDFIVGKDTLDAEIYRLTLFKLLLDKKVQVINNRNQQKQKYLLLVKKIRRCPESRKRPFRIRFNPDSKALVSPNKNELITIKVIRRRVIDCL